SDPVRAASLAGRGDSTSGRRRRSCGDAVSITRLRGPIRFHVGRYDGMNPEFLETADVIGAKLCRDAIWAGNRCNWVGPSMEFIEGDWRPVYRASGGALYNGTSGIALFLARLFDLTGHCEYRRCAEASLEQALAFSRAMPENCRYGFFTGLSGI